MFVLDFCVQRPLHGAEVDQYVRAAVQVLISREVPTEVPLSKARNP